MVGLHYKTIRSIKACIALKNGSTVSGLDLAEIINDSFIKVAADALHFDPISIQLIFFISSPDKFIIYVIK